MYEISINHKKKGRVSYEIYTKEEADTKGVAYTYWKDAKKGEYALTDDNYVGKVIQKKEYSSNNGVDSIYVRMPFGYAFHSPKYPTQKLKADGRLSNHTLSGKPQLEVRKGTQEWKNLAMVYAVVFDMELAIDAVYDNPSPSKIRTAKRWMRTQEFKSMVKDELNEVLAEKGHNRSKTIDLLDKALAMAEEKKDITNFLRVVENIQDMLGMRDKTVTKTTTQLEASATRKLLDEINEEEAQLKGKQVTIEAKTTPNTEE
tara:strand:- start:28553 stop:29329 length:777 start_codon:yes stop_codon:yes gene_type:complete